MSGGGVNDVHIFPCRNDLRFCVLAMQSVFGEDQWAVYRENGVRSWPWFWRRAWQYAGYYATFADFDSAINLACELARERAAQEVA